MYRKVDHEVHVRLLERRHVHGPAAPQRFGPARVGATSCIASHHVHAHHPPSTIVDLFITGRERCRTSWRASRMLRTTYDASPLRLLRKWTSSTARDLLNTTSHMLQDLDLRISKEARRSRSHSPTRAANCPLDLCTGKLEAFCRGC